MTAYVTSGLGDNTSRDVKPDFESGRAYYWMKQVKAARRVGARLPYKKRKGLAEESFFKQVDARLSRETFNVGISFDKDGKIIR